MRMTNMQVIPAIDLRGGRCVRLRQGDYDQETVFGDDPAAMAAHWESGGAGRIHLVDLDGAKAGRPVNVEAVRAILERVGVPCQLGGGVRDETTIATWLDAGLERVIVGTQALKDPSWFRAMAEKYPGRLVLGLDAKDGRVATEGWLDVSSVDAATLADGFDDLPLAAVVLRGTLGLAVLAAAAFFAGAFLAATPVDAARAAPVLVAAVALAAAL